MLQRLRFRNFKAWRDTGDIRLAPLTVLFGTNSAGKTSIPQLLLMLKQTAESADRQRALQLGDARSLVDLGTYADVVHNHDLEKPLEVDFDWSLPRALKIEDPLGAFPPLRGEGLHFQATFGGDARRQPRVRALRYELRGKTASLGVGMEPDEGSGGFELRAEGYPLVRRPGREAPLPPPVRFYGFPDEARAYFQNTAFTADLALELERMLRSVFYVGPLRESPRRLYLWSGEEPEHVGPRGDKAVEALLAAGERSFDLGQGPVDLQTLVAERLKTMGLIHEFSVKPLAEGRREYEVLVRTAPGRPEVKITDVGFGLSQLLPVLVECFYVPPGSIVIFEQPELHLHPRVQAELADLFVDALKARESGALRHCQFIVESHSEHFLRRLQLRIAEEALSQEEAALHYVYSEQGEARLLELDLDEFGNIRNWPESFFGDDMADLRARSEAQARRSSRREPQ